MPIGGADWRRGTSQQVLPGGHLIQEESAFNPDVQSWTLEGLPLSSHRAPSPPGPAAPRQVHAQGLQQAQRCPLPYQSTPSSLGDCSPSAPFVQPPKPSLVPFPTWGTPKRQWGCLIPEPFPGAVSWVRDGKVGISAHPPLLPRSSVFKNRHFVKKGCDSSWKQLPTYKNRAEPRPQATAWAQRHPT